MIKTHKTWMLTSALWLAAACSDDDESYVSDPSPSSSTLPDAAAPTDGAVPGNIDAGIDASSPDASNDAGAADAGPAPIALVGVWHDADYGGELQVTSTKLGAQTIVEYDNTARVGITQSPPDDMFTPNKFNKFVWTAVTSAGFYQCTQDYGKDTLEAAKGTTMKADPSDPANKGCGDGDFAWSHYVPALEIRGDWRSDGAAFTVTSDQFGSYDVESYDNAADTGVLSSGGGDAGAATFSKLVWTMAAGSTRVEYCIVAAGFSSAEQAEASTATADIAQPTTGCNGGAWSGLTK